MYRITWISKLTGFTGHGEWVFSFEVGSQTVEAANRLYPEIFHTLEGPKDPEPPAST